MTNAPQTFWLETLKDSHQYNHWVFSQILPHLGREVLEVGCGNGNFTVLLSQHCPRVVAVDINEEYVLAAQTRLEGKPGVEVVQQDATKIQGDRIFDTIVMLDILEHIKNDVKVLRQLSCSLRPGGKLVIKVPALTCLYSPMDKAIGHYRRYTKKTLNQVFRKANFSKAVVWYFNLAAIPGWWLNGKVLGRTTPPSEQVSLFDKAVPFLRTVESWVEPPLGLSLFAVATKT